MSTERGDGNAKGQGAPDSETTKHGGGGPLSLVLPPDRAVWREARKLTVDKNVRVEDLATCCSQDPVIVIELLKTSNALYFSGGRQAITSTKTAIVRLGSDVVLETLEGLGSRPDIEDEDVSHWFELHRSRCKRTAIISRMLAEVIAKALSDECQAAGLLLYVGEMIAALHLKEQYVKLAEELSRSGILYKLKQEYRFDVDTLGPAFLARNGIPQVLLTAIDRDSVSRTPDKAIMKPLVAAAAEMVEAFDANRWEKLAPGKTIPPKSAIRLLQINENQYLKLYEKASQYLFSIRTIEEKKKQEELMGTGSSSGASFDQNALDSEIKSLMQTAPEQTVEVKFKPSAVSTPLVEKPKVEPKPQDEFSLKSKPKSTPRLPSASRVKAPEISLSKARAVVTAMTSVIESAQNSEELLSSLLAQLVENGPFEKSALIVVSQDRKNAIVVAARGPNIGNGQRIAINDPLSPLAQCFSSVKSFGNEESSVSPFGSKTFAIAPIDADHDTPVALYADCGNNGSISFEARRIFRTVVEVLNQKLPQLPGGIPVEFSQ